MILASGPAKRFCLASLALFAPLTALTLTGCSGGSNSAAPSVVVVSPLDVTSINPTSGPAGTTVTINGTGFVHVTEVLFGTTNATSFTVVSPTEITAVVPALLPGIAHIPPNQNITVVTSTGTSSISSADIFSYAAPPAPAISAITPSTGTTAGGTSVAITGSGFLSGSTVSFGTVAAASVTFVDSTHLTAISPAGSTGTVDVTVTDTNGTSSTGASDQFTYTSAAPTITSFTPTIGVGGETVTIIGTGFTGATAVDIGTSATFTVVSNTEITATVPLYPFPGPETVSVQVVTPAGTATAPGSFTNEGIP
jgi:hypothetical protein